MKRFRGRIIAPGKATAPALVSTQTVDASGAFRKALESGDKKVTCADKKQTELYKKAMAGKALCIPRFSGSDTDGLTLYCICTKEIRPACILLSEPIDVLSASGAIMASIWLEQGRMPVIDSLGETFLQYVKNEMTVSVDEDGIVCIS